LLRTRALPEGSYLAVLAALPPLVMLSQFVAKNYLDFVRIDIPIQALGIVVAALVLLLQRTRLPPPPMFRAFAVILGLTVLGVVVASAYHGSEIPRSVAVIGGAIILIVIGGASNESATRALDVLALGFLIVCLATLIIDPPESGRVVGLGFGEGFADSSLRYWLPLSLVTPWDTQWAGPAGHPNSLGQLGAFVAVWGVARYGWRRLAMLGGGIIVVILTGSRTSYLALVFGIAVLVAVYVIQRSGNRIVSALVLALPALLMVALVIANPSLTGRTEAWRSYRDLGWREPVLGVGDSAIIQAQMSDQIPIWANTAHNVLLDALVRHGLIVALLLATAVVLSGWLCVKGLVGGVAPPMALFVVFLLGNVTETHADIRYWSVQVSFLVLATLLASTPASRLSDGASRHVSN